MPMGQGSGGGAGRTRRGGGHTTIAGKRISTGPGGYCVCPACSEKSAHQAGVPCYSVHCPKCGASMIRE